MAKPRPFSAQTTRAALEAASDERTAAVRRREIQPLRGIRGVSHGDIARITAEAWTTNPKLPGDIDGLDDLFSNSFEEGLVAIGLVAACVPDAASEAWDLADTWLERIDDTETADALGWLVLGPAALVTGGGVIDLLSLNHPGRSSYARRAIIASGLALTPAPVRGPAAAALRARIGQRELRYVEAPLDEALAALLTAFARDSDPPVQKATRRVLSEWSASNPEAASEWATTFKGGLPKFLSEVVKSKKPRK